MKVSVSQPSTRFARWQPWTEISPAARDTADQKLLDDLRNRLREIANDIRIDGLVIVTDLGDAMHKRLLGIKATAEAQHNSDTIDG